MAQVGFNGKISGIWNCRCTWMPPNDYYNPGSILLSKNRGLSWKPAGMAVEFTYHATVCRQTYQYKFNLSNRELSQSRNQSIDIVRFYCQRAERMIWQILVNLSDEEGEDAQASDQG